MFSSRPEGTGSWHFQDSFIFIARFLETGIQRSLNKIACCVSCYICTHFLPRFSSFFRIFLKRSLTLGSSHRLFAAGCSCIASSENADGIWWNAIYCNSNCSTPNDGYIWLNDPNVFELHIWIHLDQIILSMIQYDTVKTWQKIPTEQLSLHWDPFAIFAIFAEVLCEELVDGYTNSRVPRWVTAIALQMVPSSEAFPKDFDQSNESPGDHWWVMFHGW